LNRPVNFLGAVMKIWVGEIVPTGIIAIAIAASKDIFWFRDRPDLGVTQQLHQNIIVGHLTPVLPSLGQPTTTLDVHTTTDILNPCEAT
jgi:hypothetical protein